MSDEPTLKCVSNGNVLTMAGCVCVDCDKLKEELAQAREELECLKETNELNRVKRDALRDALAYAKELYLAEHQECVEALSKLDDVEEELKAQKAKWQEAIKWVESSFCRTQRGDVTREQEIYNEGVARCLQILREAQGETTTEKKR